jgi:hypothetical protein
MPRNARVVIPPTCLFTVRKVSRGGSGGWMTPAPAGRSGPSDGRSVRELVFGSQGEILGRAPCKRNSGFVQLELTASPPGEKRILSVFLPLVPGSSRSVRARRKPARDRNQSFPGAAPISGIPETSYQFPGRIAYALPRCYATISAMTSSGWSFSASRSHLRRRRQLSRGGSGGRRYPLSRSVIRSSGPSGWTRGYVGSWPEHATNKIAKQPVMLEVVLSRAQLPPPSGRGGGGGE